MQQHIAPYTKKYLKARSKEVNSIQNEINRIFDQHIAPYERAQLAETFVDPDIEISETAKNVCVTAELPGMNANDINLNISKDGYLTISGEKQTHTNKKMMKVFIFQNGPMASSIAQLNSLQILMKKTLTPLLKMGF